MARICADTRRADRLDRGRQQLAKPGDGRVNLRGHSLERVGHGLEAGLEESERRVGERLQVGFEQIDGLGQPRLHQRRQLADALLHEVIEERLCRGDGVGDRRLDVSDLQRLHNSRAAVVLDSLQCQRGR